MNLATRDLIDEQNYPLVAQSDFFDVQPNQVLLQIPLAAGEGTKQLRPVVIGAVDAVVGNPPYVRQEEISKPPTASTKGRVKFARATEKHLRAEAVAYKKRLDKLASLVWEPLDLSGRSDLHVYFWPHITRFLKPDGWFGFLTSSGWLDVEYGFRLQDFLLNHYRIVAIFESQVEPWFTGARVTTCATILRREYDRAARDANLVKFVQLRSPLSEVFPHDVTEEQRQLGAEALRDRIESMKENTAERHWRVRVRPQGELHELGRRGTKSYRGAKWGLYLRAPDLFLKLQERYGDRLVPISDVAETRCGIKTGCDQFFFVRDITDECLKETPDSREFRAKYGIQRFQTDRVRIIKSGDGSVHLIETEYLEPEVHNLMENNGVFGVWINPKDLRLKVILCDESKTKLKNKHILKYIRWGERERFDERPSCRRNPWYDVKQPERRGDVFWPEGHQYRHLAPLNHGKLICNHKVLELLARQGVDPRVLCGIANSTFSGLSKHFFGRPAGTEGNLQTAVVDLELMLVPDVRTATKDVRKRIVAAVAQMAKRPTCNLPDEFELADRQALDDAVLELLGETDPAERRRLRDELYDEVTAMYRGIRDKELQMIEFKKQSARGGGPAPEQVTEEVVETLDASLVRRPPEDFIRDD